MISKISSSSLLNITIDIYSQNSWIFHKVTLSLSPTSCKSLNEEEGILGGTTFLNVFETPGEVSVCEAMRMSPTMIRLMSANIALMFFIQSLERDMSPVRTKLVHLRMLQRFYNFPMGIFVFATKLSSGHPFRYIATAPFIGSVQQRAPQCAQYQAPVFAPLATHQSTSTTGQSPQS